MTLKLEEILECGGEYLVNDIGTEYVENKGEVIAKKCRTCKEWKWIFEYNDSNRGVGGKRAGCRKCRSEYMKAWRKLNADHCRNYIQENSAKRRQSTMRWRERNKDWIREYDKIYRTHNQGKKKASDARRNARKEKLPDTYSYDDHMKTMKFFGGACALSGTKDDLHLDHVIPLATGQVGSIFGNIVPLAAKLNTSKRDFNIFEWFEANRQRFELSQKKFDRLIGFLADANEMSVDEYRNYVKQCFDNQRYYNEEITKEESQCQK